MTAILIISKLLVQLFKCSSISIPTNKTTTLSKQTFTRSQLALHNGQDKATIYVAFRGQVYDVTRSRLWRNGKHYEHWAGQDLTAELADAPHNEQVFERFDCVGELQQ